jgi:O-antigen/teichoic acid export membrane protein
MGTPAALPQTTAPAEAARSVRLDVRSLGRRLVASPLVHRFLYGAAWSSFATASSRVFLLIAMIGVARILGRELHGRLGVVQNTVGMLGIFAGLGLGLATTRLIAQHRRFSPARAGRIAACAQGLSLLLSVVVAAVNWVAAPCLARQVLGDASLHEALRIGGGLVVCGALNGVITGILSGFEAFRALAIVNAASGVAALAFVIAGAHWGGVTGAVWGLVATAALQVALGQVALGSVTVSEGVSLQFTGAWRETGAVLHIGLPAALSAITVIPVEWAATALLVNQPGGYAQMGLYSAAVLWFNALQLIPASLGQALLPQMSERWASGDQRGLCRLMLLGMGTNFVALAPLVVLGWWSSQWLMARNGAAFAEGAGALRLLLAAMLVVALQTPVGNFLHASGRSWISLWMNGAWAIAYLAAAWWSVAGGAAGLAGARLFAYGAHTVWVLAFVAWILCHSPRANAVLLESA